MQLAREAIAHLNIADPLVAWLAVRGEMVSSAQAHEQALGFWLTRALRAERSLGHRGAIFDDELALEALRQARYPNAVSRLRGFYLFDDAYSADRAMTQWPGFLREALLDVGILEGSQYSRHDAQWITLHMGQPDRSWMNDYLSGKASGPEPVWELLVDGRALVFGTDLREKAFAMVERVWPRSTPLLELSRIAVELESDLGLIVPMVHGESDQPRIDYVMNFADARDPGFLGRFQKFTGHKNTQLLSEGFELVLPDLRPQGFPLPTAQSAN